MVLAVDPDVLVVTDSLEMRVLALETAAAPTVRDFALGDITDGVTDATQAFRDYLLWLGRKEPKGVGGGVFRFPDSGGEYRLTETVLVDLFEGRFTGSGTGPAPGYNGGHGTAIKWDGDDLTPMFKVTDSRHLRFQDIRFEGRNSSPPTYAIEFVNEGGSMGANVANLVVADCVIGEYPWTVNPATADGQVQNGIGFTGINGNNAEYRIARTSIRAVGTGLYLPNTQSTWGSVTDCIFNRCNVGIDSNTPLKAFNVAFQTCDTDLEIRGGRVDVFGLSSEHTGRLANLSHNAHLRIMGGKTQADQCRDGILIAAFPSHRQDIILRDFTMDKPLNDNFANARITFGPDQSAGAGRFDINITGRGMDPAQLDFVGAMWAWEPESHGRVEWRTTEGNQLHQFRNELRTSGRTTIDTDVWDLPRNGAN